MKSRKLRVAWSVVWGVAVVLSLCLWVRSHKPNRDRSYVFGNYITSTQGVIMFWHVGTSPAARRIFTSFANAPAATMHEGQSGWLGFFASSETGFWRAQVPYWFVVLLAIGVGVAPWMRRRFALRTLLLAMTAVAVVLGLIAWSIH